MDEAPIEIPRGAAAESSRVDVWLWAVRLFPTRSKSAASCRAGHVRVNGERAKPATVVKPGDGVEVRGLDRPRIVVVTHRATDEALSETVAALADHEAVQSINSVLRMEGTSK